MRNNFIKKTLKNGVKLYLYLDKNMKRKFVSYSVNYGSSGEYSDFYLDGEHHHVIPGCAHFLEHILGEHSMYGNIYIDFTKKKYDRNGLTSMDYTTYYFMGIQDVENSIKKLITAIDNPVFTEEDVIETSKAICEEAKKIRDDKRGVARAMTTRNLYSGVELYDKSLCSIGDEFTTKQIDAEMLMACYDAFYSDDNKTLVIAGNFVEEEIIRYVESIYDALPKHPNRRKEYQYNTQDIREKSAIEYMSTEDDFVMMGFRNKLNSKFSFKEIYYFVHFIFFSKFTKDSAFVERLKKDDIVTDGLGKNLNFYKDNINIFINTYVRDCEKFVDSLISELEINSFTLEDFELFKRTKIADNAGYIDFKYDLFTNFIFRINYSDDFDDISFIRGMSFERFLEFYSELTFDKNTVSIIRNKKLM